MEFWGVEVKQGQSLKVTPDDDKIIHISQASLCEVKDDKAANKVPLRLKIDEKKFVIGSLSAGDRPQIMFDLVFEKEFELSHDCKNGSVYFIGYQTMDPCNDEEDYGEGSDFSSDEELPIDASENGKLVSMVDAMKPEKKATEALPSKKPALKAALPKKEEPESDEDDSSDEDEDSEDLDQIMGDDESDSDDSDKDDSDEEPPVKGKQQNKKRPAEKVPETRAPSKKAKQATPDKSGGKKVAPPAKSGKAPQQSGKSPQFNNANKKPQKKFNQRKH